MKIMEGTMQHIDITYMCLFISQLNEIIIHSTFQVNSSSCSFVWLLGFAATFVTVTLRKEIKFSFGVCCLPDECWCWAGRAGGGHSSACKSFTTIMVKKIIPESSSCSVGGRWCQIWQSREGWNKVNIEHEPCSCCWQCWGGRAGGNPGVVPSPPPSLLFALQTLI